MTLKSISKYRKLFEKKIDKKLEKQIFDLMVKELESGKDPKQAAEEVAKKLKDVTAKDILKLTRFEEVQETAVNAISTGNIAGAPPDEPPVRRRKKKEFGEVFKVSDKAFKHFINYKKLPEEAKFVENFSKLYPKVSVVIQNETTGALMFFRRKQLK